MIKMEIIESKLDHVIIRANEPIRLEIIKAGDGQLVLFGYSGIKDDQEQEPILSYDSSESNKEQEF